MPKRTDIQTILLIGSGPIVIGQACEFDYSGTQALRVLREEGYRTVLVNSNPATIMTDPGWADRTYLEPLDVQGVRSVLELERPDALRSDLADPRRARRETRGLEVDDDEMRVLERDVRARRRREPDRCAAPGEPRVAGDDVVEQRPGKRRRRARESEQRPRRLVGRHRPAPGLDELDEPVGGIERELHARERNRTCVRIQAG